MAKLIDKFMGWVEKLVTLLLGLEVITIVAQIFFRYILKDPLNWSDQACRFGLVWIIMLGFPVMFNRKATVCFDLIFAKTKGKLKKIFELFFALCTLFFAVTFLLCAVQYVQKCGAQSVPGFPFLKFWMLYGAEVVCGALMSIVMLKEIGVILANFNKPDEPKQIEE